jgi:DNA adenine methylase
MNDPTSLVHILRKPDAVRARPFVKMAGGKSKLIPELLARMPSTFENYYEPFVGGGALFFYLSASSTLSKTASDRERCFVIGDTNEDLIASYRAVRDTPRDLVRRLRGMKNTEAFFRKVREIDLSQLPGDTMGLTAATAARFIYLNKTCFNGLHRVNRAGQFNTPFGHYPKPAICDEANLRACSRVLKRAAIRNGPFAATVVDAKPGDLVYFDPPYMPIAEQSFTSYSANGFGYGQHAELAGCARELRARGVHVMISNSDTARVRALYEGFTIHEVQAARSINATGSGRGKITELIIT